MDQNNIDTPQQPATQPESVTPPPPKKGWPFSKKVTIIGAVIAVILVVVIGIFISGLTNKDKPIANGGLDPSIYYLRPNYKLDSDGVGDPAALVSSSTSKVVKYGGIDILQPCSLVTIADLQEFGLQLSQNPLAAPVESSSFDGRIDTPLKISNSFLPSQPEGNFCQYFLDGRERVTVSAYQTSYASVKALDHKLEGYESVADTNGIKTYKDKDTSKVSGKLSEYILRDGDRAVHLYLDMENEEMKNKILKHTATRFSEAKSRPTPTQKFEFKSPVFTEPALTSCDVISPGVFRAVSGENASPTINQTYGTAVGVVELTKGTLYNYVSYDCTVRSSVELSSAMMSIKTRTYETVEGATKAFAFESGEDVTHNIKPVTPIVGDESFYGDTAAASKALVVRKGRLLIMTTFSGGVNNVATPEKRIEILSPVLRNWVTNELKVY